MKREKERGRKITFLLPSDSSSIGHCNIVSSVALHTFLIISIFNWQINTVTFINPENFCGQ